MKQKKVIAACLLALAIPLGAAAAGLVPCGGPTEKPCTVQDAFYMVARVTNWLIMMAGIFATFQLVSAGFWLVASMGNEENVAKWKKSITNSVVGLFLVFGAYMFMNTAVNFILRSRCQIDLADPLTYVRMTDPSNMEQCKNPVNSDIDPSAN